MKQTFRQSMAWLHTWAGLSVVWVLFFMFVMGTISYFEEELNHWMQPERPISQTAQDQGALLDMGAARLATKADSIGEWYMILPNGRESAFEIEWEVATDTDHGHKDVSEVFIPEDPNNGGKAHWVTPRLTGGGEALYRMHFALHYMPRTVAYWIVTICTMFMFVSIITGVVVHKKIFKDFFTFRPMKGQRSWLDMHNILAVMALPFHLMITYSGLLFFMLTVFPVIAVATYGTNGEAIRAAINEVFPRPNIEREATGKAMPLASLKPMLETAEARWGKDQVWFVGIENPGDENALVTFRRHRHNLVSNNEIYDRLIFDGVTGELLTKEPSTPFSGLVTTHRTMLNIHMGLYAGPALRWLYFLTGLLGTAMIGTGMLLWTSKRRQKQEKSPEGVKRSLVVIERLNAGTIAGLLVAVAAYFWANRLLPIELEQRAALEQNILFFSWAASLFYASWRPLTSAWKELLLFGAGLFGLLPLLNALTTDYHLGVTLPARAWSLAGVDLTLLIIGLLTAYAARVLHKRQSLTPSLHAQPERPVSPKFLEAAE